MVNIYTEDFFLNLYEKGDSFQPLNFTFIIIYAGEMEVANNRFSVCHNAGQVLFMSPFNLYKVVGLSVDLKVYVFSMDRAIMRRKINFNFSRYEIYKITNVDSKGSLIPFNIIEFDHVLTIAQQIIFYNENSVEAFKEDILNSLFSALVYTVVEKALESKNKFSITKSRKEEITIEFISLVYDHFKKNKELRFYADRLHVSIKYLSNCVRITTKVPPTQIIADASITEAKILLLNKENTISAIANLLGFSDQYAFGKFFKKNTGYSPLNFRKLNNLVHSI